ncbi:MAG: hypothetical protein HOG49_05600 [Candidatus Scalindua sp.]|jgi:hypothetical protein|nr:hypothetical protein [Candidatus Scalindua sp.]
MREPTQEVPFGDDDKRAMRVEGSYPAHIIGLTSREFAGGNEVFNLKVRVADEAETIKVPKYIYDADSERYRAPVLDDDGNQVFIPAKFMVGQELDDNGTWFYEDAKLDWQTNEKYADRMNSLGVEFPEKEVGKGKNKVVKQLLQKIDADDVLGLPCFIEYGWMKYPKKAKNEDSGEWEKVKDEDGKQVYGETLKVLNYLPWPKGEKIEIAEGDEDAPF